MILTRVGETGLFMSIIDMITRIPGLQGTGRLRDTGHLQGTGPRGWGVLPAAGLQAADPQE